MSSAQFDRCHELAATAAPPSLAQSLLAPPLDADTDPMFVVSSECRMLLANSAGRETLILGSPFLERNGHLALSNLQLHAAFLSAVDLCCSGGDACSLGLGDAEPGHHLIIEGGRGMAGFFACIYVRSLKTRLHRILDRASAAFHLTPAERLLAEALMRGVSTAEFVERRNIKITTVRSQLASLYSKAGVCGHAQLVAALCGLTPY